MKKDIYDLLNEYRDVKESGTKIYLSYEAIRKLCGIKRSLLTDKLKWLIKSGKAEVIEVVLPSENTMSGVKRIKAIRLV